MTRYPEIIFDAERMKYAHTGIYHYCLHLGAALVRQQAHHNYKLGFYLPRAVNEIFGKEEFYIRQRSLHKLVMPGLSKHQLWHSTFQGTNYFPAGSGIKKMITVHDLNFLHENKTVTKQQKYLSVLQEKLDRVDSIVVISNFVKQEIETHLKVDSNKIEVIYNGCNIRNDVTPRRPQLGFDSPFFFSIGTIAPKKNFHVLPASLLNNNYHLVIAGIYQDEKYLQKIKDEATKLGVVDRVHLIGSVTEEEKYWLLQNCSLFLFASLAEGFGLPVIEAMRFGKPMLLSTATSLPEIGGDIAFYLQNFDATYVSEMADHALKNTSEDLERRTIEWSQKFSWDNAAKQYWNVYETLLND